MKLKASGSNETLIRINGIVNWASVRENQTCWNRRSSRTFAHICKDKLHKYLQGAFAKECQGEFELITSENNNSRHDCANKFISVKNNMFDSLHRSTKVRSVHNCMFGSLHSSNKGEQRTRSWLARYSSTIYIWVVGMGKEIILVSSIGWCLTNQVGAWLHKLVLIDMSWWS